MIRIPSVYNQSAYHLLITLKGSPINHCLKSLLYTMASTKIRVKIGDFPTLSARNVHMKSPLDVENILNELVLGGETQLQMIADFDRTLTQPYQNGRPCLSSFGVFHTCARMPIDYIRQADDLFHFYRPLETDPNIDIDEKSLLMEEWTKREADLLDFELDKKDIDDAAARADVALRKGTEMMLKRLSERDVPMLIFSAGLGDTVLAVLQHKNAMHPNMHVISNFLKWEGKKLCGLQGDIIHTFNKNEHAVVNTPYFNELKEKKNVILLGDSLGDAAMSDGVPNMNVVLKIGFLEDQINDYLPAYEELFDIVFIKDSSMEFLNELLAKILLL